MNKLISLESHLNPSMTTKNQTKNKFLNLINSINLIDLSIAKQNSPLIDQALDSLYLNLSFSIGYSLSLVLTSVLISRLYLTSKSSCKLGLFGSCLNVIMISMLNSCLFRNCFNQSNLVDSIDKGSTLAANSKEMVYNEYINLSIRFLEFTRTNIYLLQISFFVIYGYFQAKLNYSLQMLLIERFSNRRLTKAISLQRCTFALGHICLLLFRIILNYLNDLISFESFCRFDCSIFVSNFFIFISTLLAILILHFISNRSINRFRSKKNKQTKVVNENSLIKVFLRKLLKAFNLFKFGSLVSKRANLKNKDKINACLDEKRFKYKKQLSDSNLNFIGRISSLSPKKANLNRFNSDLNLFKNLDNPLLMNLKTNYLIDCILCGRSYLVSLDLEKLQLDEHRFKVNELFSIEKVDKELFDKDLEQKK